MVEHLNTKTKVDMSSEAITARLKRCCGLGDAERRAKMIRELMAEIKSGSKAPESRKRKKATDARIHS